MSASINDKTSDDNSPELSKIRKELIENHPEAKIIRPCSTYRRECEACFASTSRIKQLYVNGEMSDCSPLINIFDKCNAMEKGGDGAVDAMNELIEYEKQKINNKEKMKQINDVWEYRSSPPEHWSAPYPEFLESRKETHLQEIGDTWEQKELRLSVRECLMTGELCCIL
ncbi:uncharacterized protein LOC111133937 isoform X1 [Crassostrea virginica]